MKMFIHVVMAVVLMLAMVSIGSSGAIAQVTLLNQNFDGVTPPAFPSGWSVDVPDIGGVWTWRTTAGVYNPSSPGPPTAPNVATFQSYNLPDGSTARLIMPNMDWSAITAPAFTFSYRRDGQYTNRNDRIFIDGSTDGGGTWEEIAGPYIRTSGTIGYHYWQDISLAVDALAPYVGRSSVKFAFRAISAWGNWIHIDNVVITGTSGLANDMGIVVINSPAADIFRMPQTITASVRNFGTADQTTYNIHVKIWKTVGGSPATPEFERVQAGPPITAGATLPFSFFDQWMPLEYGAYSVKVYTELAGDQNFSNDAMTKSVTVNVQTDLQVTTIVYPATSGLYVGTLGYSVRGTVKNNGTSTVSGADYTVDGWIGPSAGFPGSATYTGAAVFRPDIAPGASVQVNLLPSAWVPAEPGPHTVRIKVTMAGDEVPSNDTRDESRTVLTVHFGGPDAGGYYFVTNGRPSGVKPTYNWLDIRTVGTALNLADDGNSAAISIPGFTLYGTTYTSLKVNNNGIIRFDAGPDQNYYSNLSIPNSAAPDFFLAPFWDDLAPGSATSGNVYYYNDAAHSQFIIEWYQIARLGETQNPNTFEVVINYANGAIFFQYNSFPGNKSASTIGIEKDGTAGTQWLFDGNPSPAMNALVDGRVIYIGTDTSSVPAIQSLGGSAAFSVAPSSLSFGDVVVGLTSAVQTLTVTNSGTATLTIDSVKANDPTFAVSPTSGVILPTSNQEFYVTFAPTIIGAVSGRVSFWSDAATSPDTVHVSGNGTFARVIVAHNAGWDLVSNPVTRLANTDSVKQLYPSSVNDYVFSYVPGSGYQQRFVMPNGSGFWGKFPSGGLDTISGFARPLDSISVVAGWNLVGSITSPIRSASVVSVPPGIIAGSFFGYNGSYGIADTIKPGRAYWVKANVAGRLVLSVFQNLNASAGIAPADLLESLNKLTLSDTRGKVQEIFYGKVGGNSPPLSFFEPPPQPPEGGFSACFLVNARPSLVALRSREDTTFEKYEIAIQGAEYPITISWNVRQANDAGYLLSVGPEGQPTAVHPLKDRGSIRISTKALSGLRLESRRLSVAELPREFALYQNYPNPFNPLTMIRFDLPVASRMSLRVYDLLGREVAVLVEGEQPAGAHDVTFNSGSLASGIYFYRMQTERFTSVRKMPIIK